MNWRPIIFISGLIVLVAGILFFNQPENKTTEVSKPAEAVQVKKEPPKPTLITDEDVEAKLNQFRVNRGLSQLANDSQLDLAAQERANDMCANNTFEHDGWKAVLWQYYDRSEYRYAGENLYYGTLRDGQADDAINGWAGSPTHLENMAGNYSQMGMGVKLCDNYLGEQNVVIVTNYFRLP